MYQSFSSLNIIPDVNINIIFFQKNKKKHKYYFALVFFFAVKKPLIRLTQNNIHFKFTIPSEKQNQMKNIYNSMKAIVI